MAANEGAGGCDRDICAACGKRCNELKACAACRLVKYCNRECQLAHRSAQKANCKRRVAELHDEKLFKQPPPDEDCPVCLLTLPYDHRHVSYQVCCGKVVCIGCMDAVEDAVRDEGGDEAPCPFCRATYDYVQDDDLLERINKRMEANNAFSYCMMGSFFMHGMHGLPQDVDKAMELWHRAGELGLAHAYACVAQTYYTGDAGFEKDMKKARHYLELAAMGGNVSSRHNLAFIEMENGNMQRAIKHSMIAACAGHDPDMNTVRVSFTKGMVSNEDYETTLRAWKDASDGMKSEQRDKAARIRELRG